MPNPPGMYVPLDMNYMRDPAIRRAGPDAEHLFIRSLAHAKAGGTDGLIGDYDLPVVAIGLKAVPARVKALVRERLWTEVDGGWLITNWRKWNFTTAELEQQKDKKRKAAAATNHQRWHVEKGEVSASCDLCSESP